MSTKVPVEQFEMASNVRSICSPDTQNNLLNAWRKKDLEGFQETLRRDDCDPNYLYSNDSYMRLLDKAASEGLPSYAEALIDAGAKVNQVNPAKSKAPIHFAVEAGQLEVLQLLVSRGADVNILDSTGSTPLHFLARQKWVKGEVMFENCMEFLLSRPELKLNVPNRKGFTAAHTAVHEGALEALKFLLNKGSELDLDSFRVGLKKTTAREEILLKYPKLEADLPVRLAVHEIKMDESMLFSLLHDNHEDRFVEQFKKEMNDKAQQGLLTKTDGKATFLQTACEKGFKHAVEVLLDHGADVNLAPLSSTPSPVGIACRNGDLQVLRVLLKKKPKLEPDGFKDSVLHTLVKLTGDSEPHQKCLEYLLKYYKSEGLDVNCQDMKGNTPLHYAVKYSNENCVLMLLQYGAYLGAINMFKDPPLAHMTHSTLKKYLDSTISSNEALPREENYAWRVDYRFLMPNLKTQRKEDLEEVKVPLKDEPDVEKKVLPTPSSVPESDPLLYISRSADLRHLLMHPVLRNFIFLKWQRIQNFYYVNALFYSIFWALLTIYILAGYRNKAVSPVVASSLVVPPDSRSKVAHDKFVADSPFHEGNATSNDVLSGALEHVEGSVVVDLVRGVLVIFLVLIALREMFQLWINPRKYLASMENWLEIILIIVSAFVVLKDCSREFPESRRLSVWCPQFCAIAILVSWFELVLLIGKHPRLSLNIEMFKTVSITFLQFLAWYAILIIAFALSFYTLFRGCTEDCSESNPFTNPGLSVFKTIVMLTGEFEAGDIPFVSFIGTSHIIFVAFVFLIAIVLFNLLNGLAVTDTQAIREDAFLYSTIAQVKAISHIENLFLGEDSPLKLRLRRLRSLVCCCQGDNPDNIVCYNYFSQRISFFPSFIPDGLLYIYPNQNYRIECGDRTKVPDGPVENCISRGGYFMEKSSAKAVEEILAITSKVEEKTDDQVEILKNEIITYKEKLNDFEKKLQSLESSNKQSEQLLIQILAILSFNNANNER